MITNSQIANGRFWCVAGGWAACPQLASDQDVWIFALPGENLEVVKSEILAAQMDIEDDQVSTADAEAYENLGVDIIRVGKLDNRHIMVTDAQDIEMLLDCFDVSTHQCAVTSNLEFVKGHGWTPITVSPVSLRETTNTLARLKKISERYAGLVPAKRRIERLVA